MRLFSSRFQCRRVLTMPDPYALIAQTHESLQIQLADVIELRAADPQHTIAVSLAANCQRSEVKGSKTAISRCVSKF